MKAFNCDDGYVYFLITMRLCLAVLIYVSITLFYGLGIPGKFISPQERWSCPVIQMNRWVAGDKRCWSKTLKTLSFCYWRNKLTRDCWFHCLFYPIWVDINELCLPFAKQLHFFLSCLVLRLRMFECDQMWFVYWPQTKNKDGRWSGWLNCTWLFQIPD